MPYEAIRANLAVGLIVFAYTTSNDVKPPPRPPISAEAPTRTIYQANHNHRHYGCRTQLKRHHRCRRYRRLFRLYRQPKSNQPPSRSTHYAAHFPANRFTGSIELEAWSPFCNDTPLINVECGECPARSASAIQAQRKSRTVGRAAMHSGDALSQNETGSTRFWRLVKARSGQQQISD
jgi:hypothetical protein